MSLLVVASSLYAAMQHRDRLLATPALRNADIECKKFDRHAEIVSLVEEHFAAAPSLSACLIDPGFTGEQDVRLDHHDRQDAWLAQTVLSFPELRIELLLSAGSTATAGQISSWSKQYGYEFIPSSAQHGITLTCALEYLVLELSPLFDPSGRRRLIRAQAREQISSDVVIAIDDEQLFAQIHGYACFLAGFGVSIVWRADQLHALELSRSAPNAQALAAIVTDWDLRFEDAVGADAHTAPDSAGEAELARRRVLALPGAGNAALMVVTATPYRNLIEHGLFRSKAVGTAQSARALQAPLDEHRLAVLEKPIGGILHVERRLRELTSRAAHFDEIAAAKSIPLESTDRHSAPYARKAVADRLLRRARACAKHTDDITRLLQAAVFAREARLLLGGLARTTSFECLALQHEAEVLAELAFLGFAGGLDAKSRLRLLETQGAMIVSPRTGQNTATPAKRGSIAGAAKRSLDNFLVASTERLRKAYAESDQVVASDACLVAISRFQRSLILNRTAESDLPGRLMTIPRRAIDAIAYAATGYFDVSTKSGTSAFRWFMSLCFLAGLQTALLGFLIAGIAPAQPLNETAALAFRSSFYSLTGDDPHSLAVTFAGSTSLMLGIEMWFRLLTGIVHVGFLLAILYRTVTRRAA